MPRPKPKTLIRTCSICGTQFETVDNARGREKVTCSKSCASRKAYQSQKVRTQCSVCSEITETSKSVVGAGLPVYCEICTNFRYQRRCSVCGKRFRAKRYTTHLCSQECITEHNRANLKDVTCFCCGVGFQQASFSVYSGKRIFCSDRCAMRQFSRDNPTRYGGTWSRWLRKIRKRDGNQCLKCGAKEGNLQVHHFQKLLLFDNPNEAHFDENLGLFCLVCHEEIEHLGIGSLTDFYGRYSPTP